MQNRTFLLLFRPIFGEKLKTAPPKGNWVPKSWGRCCDSVWKSVWIFDFGRKIRLNFGEDLFIYLFFFGDHLFLGWKNVWISDFGRKFRWRPFFFLFFFGDHLFLGWKNVWISELSEKFPLNFRTNRVKLIQEQWKFGSRSCALFSLFQKSPPPFSKSWLRACILVILRFYFFTKVPVLQHYTVYKH